MEMRRGPRRVSVVRWLAAGAIFELYVGWYLHIYNTFAYRYVNKTTLKSTQKVLKGTEEAEAVE